MQKCNKCEAELSEQETELCSKCASNKKTAKTLKNNDTADKSRDKSGDITLTKKQQQIRLAFTIAAGIVIVALTIALILVMIPSRDDDTRGYGDSDLLLGEAGAFDIFCEVEAREETIAEAARILNLLKEYDGDDFDSFFTQKMFEHSDDPGLLSHPDGYLFQFHDMVGEFSSAAAALGYGEISDLVETDFGIHIIYRIPVNPDAVPISNTPGDSRSLRTQMAMGSANSLFDEWVENFEPEFTEEYNSIDIIELLMLSGESNAENYDAEDSYAEDFNGEDSYAEDYNGADSDPEEPSETPATMVLADFDFEEIFAAFEPDTPMIVFGDYFVTWEELFSNIFWNLANEYRQNMGALPDLSELSPFDSRPFGEIVFERATEEAKGKLAIEFHASDLGFSLSEEDYQTVDEDIDAIIEHFGGEEEFLELLWEESGVKNIELFRQTLISGRLPFAIYREMYGEDGALFPTEQVLAGAQEEGFMMAKHILFRFPEPGT